MSSRRSSHSHRSSRSSQSKQSKSTSRTSNSTSKTSNTKRSRRSSAINADFEQHLIDYNIFPEGYEYPDDQIPEPSNLDWIRRTFATLRPSLSPSSFSDSKFRDFKRANARVIVEPRVMRRVLPTLLGDADILDEEDLLFTRLDSITDNTTVDPKPDFYDGARLRDIDKRVLEDIDEDIDNQDEDGLRCSFIIPTKHYKAPVAPNFFLEAKAPSGSADVLKRQACHDGAVGARAMHELQSYAAGKPVYDNNAYTLTATYHSGTLRIYATHATPSGPGGSIEYHMTEIDGWYTTGNPNTYRQGAAALRHARELAKEWRDQFISAANERARSVNAEQSSNYSRASRTTYLAEESETSPDGFAATSFLNRAEEPEPSEDELAASYPVATSVSYYREVPEASEYEPGDTSFYPAGEPEPSEDELAASFSQPVTASFSYTAKRRSYNSLSNIIEESETSVDEVATSTAISASTKKRPSKRSEKTVSKAPRQSTSGRGRHLKK
jgi:hypothetical protein